ncbi:MFS transporter [Marinomonas sp. TI.3.20]|uniref:MFS transporter n=1 Tax=Marinomonas sp. TI.3.20 TaxID=3121296 RepID=UPI00311DDA0A
MTEKKRQNNSLILFAVLLAVFVVPSSISGTAIALPYISSHIEADLSSLQWVVNAFNLTFACFTLVWGKISDVFGRKKSFLLGAFIYTVASVGSAVSQTAIMLDIFRGLAGIGGAAIFACGSAIFIHVFDGHQRTKAFALFGTTAGLGITLGPTISGLLLDSIGWQAIFAMHAIALFLVLLVSGAIPSDKGHNGTFKQIDLLGSVLFIGSIFVWMLALSKGYEWGWHSKEILICVIGGAIAFVAFVVRVKSAEHPVLNIELLRNYRFFGLILVPVVASFTFVTLLTYFPTYLTGSMQLSASNAGLIMLFLTAPVLVFPLIAGKLSSKGVNTNLLMYLSALAMLVGAALLITIIKDGLPLVGIAVGLVLIGIGMGMSAGLVDGQALSCVKETEVGMAAGLLNTFRLGSEAIAVAVYGSILSSTVSKIVPTALQGNNAMTNESWVNAISSGNFSQFSSDSNLMEKLASIYNQAFISTNMTLTAIAVVVTALVVLYLNRDARSSFQGEANKL